MYPAAAAKAVSALCFLVSTYWPAVPSVAVLAAQIEQETCVSLTSRTCFTPNAELKTPREYGFNYGQITVTPAFNNFEVVKRMDRSLRDWRWEDRLDGSRGLIALQLMDRQAYSACTPMMGSPEDRTACMLAVYNGGLGGFRSDRRVCSNTKGCDPTRWVGNVATTSLKQKTPAAGYGQSFFQINRGYVAAITGPKLTKYKPLVEVVCSGSR